MNSKKLVRILCLILCLSVVMPCVSALGETTKVSAYLLRLREKPSSNGKVLDAYPRGTKVTILKKDDDWTKVKVHGKEGYMKTSMLAYSKNKDTDETATENSETKKTTKKTSISTGDVKYIEKGIRLNLRAEANGDSEVLGSYRGGTKVSILKKGNYWSRVEVKGQVGYMANEYLTD